jgi:hypothetical protein
MNVDQMLSQEQAGVCTLKTVWDQNGEKFFRGREGVGEDWRNGA